MPPTLRRSQRIKNKKALAATFIFSKNAATKVHCICRKPQDKRLMICCDKCNIWFHHNCVKLTANQVDSLSISKQKWFCINCKIDKKNSTKRKRGRIHRKRSPRKESAAISSIHSPPKKRHKSATINNDESALCTTETMRRLFTKSMKSLSNHNNAPFRLPFAPQTDSNDEDTDIEILSREHVQTTHEIDDNETNETVDNESDDDSIEIQAGDKWIASESFFKNKEQYEKDIKQKKKEEINKHLAQFDLKDDEEGECVVLNQNKNRKHDICPLTLQKIEDPQKNTFCSHVFERKAIQNYRQYLVKNDKQIRCPVPGCEKVLWLKC